MQDVHYYRVRLGVTQLLCTSRVVSICYVLDMGYRELNKYQTYPQISVQGLRHMLDTFLFVFAFSRVIKAYYGKGTFLLFEVHLCTYKT
jgi:hypothetical protein